MLRNTSLALIGLVALLAGTAAHAAYDDPPGRVARVNLLDGRGAMQAAGTDSWADDLLNRPLTGGDKLWVEADSRAEMHIGSTVLRLGARSALQLITVDDRVVRLRLTAGSLNVRIRNVDRDDRFEIETPAGMVALVQPGGYRLDVDDRDVRAHLAVWSGRAEVTGRSGTSIVRSDEGADMTGGDEPAIEMASVGATDSLDLWAEDRDRREDQSRSARYVSRDVVGYEELDGYGDWVVDPQYGSLWVPQRVAIDWAPYRFGYWNWIGPWGWTWIDDEPWGFAPCHYGRWVHARHGWGWSPGEREEHRPVFAPALVAWRGDRYPRRDGDHDGRGQDHQQPPKVGWVPLGYNEVYEPPFHASRDYLRAANQSNTHLGRGDIERYIDDRQRAGDQRPERRYINEGVAGAMTAVSRDTFTSARPVGHNRLPVDASDLRSAPFSARPPEVRPEARSIGRVVPSDRPVVRPDAAVFERSVGNPERAPGRVPMAQRRLEPADAPAVRQAEIQRLDRPTDRNIERPAGRPVDRPAPPPMFTRVEPRGEPRMEPRVERNIQRAPPMQIPVQRPVAVDREPQPRYMPRPDFRAPQPAAPMPEVRAAPPAPSPPVFNRENRQDRYRDRGNR